MESGPRVLVTGSGGMLGYHLRRVSASKYPRHKYAFTVKPSDGVDLESALDVRKADDFTAAVVRWKPDWIVHLAAETDVDLCERDNQHAYKTNAVGTLNASHICARRHIKLLYISTGAIFGKKVEGRVCYPEWSAPRAGNFYGFTKLEGEEFIMNHVAEHVILRAGWMFGGFEKDHKFVGKIMQQILDGKKDLKVVYDKYGSPTYAEDLSLQICSMIDQETFGMYHAAGIGDASRYDVAKAIVNCWGDPTVTVEPVASEAFKLDAPRVASEALSDSRLKMMDRLLMRDWHIALAEYISEWKRKELTGHETRI